MAAVDLARDVVALDPAALLEKVVLGGDLSKLSSAERMDYYRRVCESVGLNPLTRPFDYLTLNGKLVLYARRDAADQLRNIHGISITRVDVSYQDDLVVVTVSAQNAQGRVDTDVGVVALGTARGEARANLILKSVTKAKRRVTLSICGLGLLDETEVESIPGAVVEPASVRSVPQAARVAATPNGPPAHSTLDRVAGELAAATAGAHDGHPTRPTLDEARRDLKEACLSIGLPAPASLREVNTLAGRYGVPIVGSSAGVTADWLDRLRAALPDIPVGPLDREHMTETATLLEALRAACRLRGRDEPRSLAQLNEMATEMGLGSVSSWQTATTGWLEALRVGVQRQSTADRAGARAGMQPPPEDGGPSKDTAERSFAGWIAAAPDGATLDQLASDVLRAHAAGTIGDKAAEALLDAVDARGAELAARDLYPPDRQDPHDAAEQTGVEEVEAATAG